MRFFSAVTWTERPDESWQAHSGTITALAISNDTRLIATAGETTLKLGQSRKHGGTCRVEILFFIT